MGLYITSKKCFFGNRFREKGSVVEAEFGKDDVIPSYFKEIKKEDIAKPKTPLELQNEAQAEEIKSLREKLAQEAKVRSDATGEANVGGGKQPSGEAGDSDAEFAEKVKAELAKLDHTNDAHFTKDGKPDLNYLKEVLGKQIKRSELDAIAPDFVREVPSQ